MRQPQRLICSTVSVSCTTRFSSAASETPVLTQKNTTPTEKPERRGAVSTTYEIAPGSSPPKQKPCTMRSTTSRIDAVMPHCA